MHHHTRGQKGEYLCNGKTMDERMEAGRFKVMVNMSSDPAGIAKELNELEREIYGVIAHIDDARVLRDYIAYLRQESREFCDARQIDMRGWMDNARYRKA